MNNFQNMQTTPLPGLVTKSRLAFSERGCQEKHLPADRPRRGNTSRGSQPVPRRDDLLIRRETVWTLHDI
jgi:hypothetical protein